MIKFYIVDKSSNSLVSHKGTTYFYCDIIAMFDYNISSLLEEYVGGHTFPSHCCLSIDGIDLFEDETSTPLGAISISDLLLCLYQIEDFKSPFDRRTKPLISLLKGFDESQWNNLIVIVWGY